jgi:hypothetical protein
MWIAQNEPSMLQEMRIRKACAVADNRALATIDGARFFPAI